MGWLSLRARVGGVFLRCLVLGCLGLATAACWDRAAAQDFDLLLGEFDARLLSDPEKRLLQVGLTGAGAYSGLIDGKWGPASQAAFERYVQSEDLADEDGLVHNYHLAILGIDARAVVEDHGLAYRGGAPHGHLILTPQGPFDREGDDLVLVSRGVEIRVYAYDAAEAVALHEGLEQRLDPARAPYVVRNAHRWVTAANAGGRLFYLRTDQAPDTGRFFTTSVRELEGADRTLYRVLVGGIGDGVSARLDSADGFLGRVVAEGWAAFGAAPEPDPEVGVAAPAPRSPDETGDSVGVGTAFFVNNYELVTAAHVVDGCSRIEMTDGAPLRLVARHPALDLAVLSAPVRSDAWIALGRDGHARLGQRIFVLGYPFFGTYGTALNMTAGNVSALTGIDDDAEAVTISAPVQPGNSGGPLMARDGAAIGVVVARLNRLKVAQETGALPENVNYAISGTALLDFLEAEDVSIPRRDPQTADFDEGVPDEMQRAVIPVICRS